MNVYVAGINFQLNNLINPQFTVKDKTKCIVDLLNEISNDAKMEFDENAIVLVVLEEYALTPSALENKAKKDCLLTLENAIKNYKNIILVPGTFATYEDISTYPTGKRKEKINKIAKNYLANLDNPTYDKQDQLFQKDYFIAKKMISKDSNENQFCLQNSAYILTSQSKKQKHKKSYGFLELHKLPAHMISKSFFNIGADNPIKNIIVNNKKLEVGITICREQLFISSKSNNIESNLPPFQIIPSASVIMEKDNLFGAINIQMDKAQGLSVHVNDAHIHSTKFENIKAVTYHPFQDGCKIQKLKVPAPIVHFSHFLDKLPQATKEQDNKPQATGVFKHKAIKKDPLKTIQAIPLTATGQGLFNNKAITNRISRSENFGGFRKGFMSRS